MRSKQFIGVAVALAIMCVLAGAVYAYDHGRRDKIAKGISVGGVDIGGMTRAGAQRKLEARLLGALHEPIVIHHGTKTWKLGPREARTAVDVNAMVEDAVARSRDGNVFSRTIRGLTGGKVQANLTPTVSYSKPAVVRLLDKVRSSVDRDAVDAKLSFHPGGFTEVDGRDGLAVDASRLHSEIDAAIVSPTAKRTFVAHTHHTAPKVDDQEAGRHVPHAADHRSRELPAEAVQGAQAGQDLRHRGRHGRPRDAGGRLPHPEQGGESRLDDAQLELGRPADRGKVVPGGTPENPLKSRWLGIFNGAGIHGIDPSEYGSIGHAASHGCVRMRIPDVEDLYPRVPVGTPIYIG